MVQASLAQLNSIQPSLDFGYFIVLSSYDLKIASAQDPRQRLGPHPHIWLHVRYDPILPFATNHHRILMLREMVLPNEDVISLEILHGNCDTAARNPSP
ncbi:hypothetical protein R1flu_006852 [Riccia fluitans]|uniref:Ycf15 n=1 Tax=Riccia fluitans TaxID=41844 RepID=A0ABD1YX63_9MARC